jgi:hypothetical protein
MSGPNKPIKSGSGMAPENKPRQQLRDDDDNACQQPKLPLGFLRLAGWDS